MRITKKWLRERQETIIEFVKTIQSKKDEEVDTILKSLWPAFDTTTLTREQMICQSIILKIYEQIPNSMMW